MLGVLVVLLGGVFVFLGLNALGTAPRRDRGPESGGSPPASLRARRAAGVFWLVWGCGFIAAAFFHLVP
ncbi:MAG TPA: hypothetical protein VMR97_07980 [Acidimicrobiales bacterium]|nr:hypothetical protein [Acidimicrobiales bacterium]